jgi:hypothetical protein
LWLACTALAASALLAACGSSSGLIPLTSANKLHGDLANVQVDFSDGDCSAARTDLAGAETDFSYLLIGVSAKLAAQLQRGLAVLKVDEAAQCRSASAGSGSGSGPTGLTGPTGSSSTTSTTSTSTTTSTTTSSTSSETSVGGGSTGATCVTTTSGNGGTPVCEGTTGQGTSGIGGGGTGIGATDTGAASVGN